MSTSTICIFGEVLIDDFPDGPVIGGAPYNVARTLAYFGCDPLFISRIGDDPYGTWIREDMHKFGISDTGLQSDQRYPSGRVGVEIRHEHAAVSHQFHILPDQAYDHIASTSASQACAQRNASFAAPPDRDIIYFGTLAQRAPASRRALDDILKQSSALRYLDLNLRQDQASLDTILRSIAAADILKINEDELQVLLRLYPGLTTPEKQQFSAPGIPSIGLLRELLQTCKLQALIVTLGAQGYLYVDGEGLESRGSIASAVDVVDTVGAGDAFSAIVLLGLLRDWPRLLSLQRAQAFATAICGVRGAVGDKPFYQVWENAWSTTPLAAGNAQ
ncbi:PfkB family carbohydrate kinase [Undibacterium rugosum]|uniref:PfkB family carbohydrate kinase n=1 Tax=Undibacterium rugosum TaxID=2762291 RepID=UPI001B83F234|nr:PfkB family carbohydrate kinase [Undibacterium rugosum]MBR7778702.1 fructokinase [Undibacterium rugosum]